LAVVNVDVGCASGKIGVEIWQDFLDCVCTVASDNADDNLSANHVQLLSPSQVCSFVIGRSFSLFSLLLFPAGF